MDKTTNGYNWLQIFYDINHRDKTYNGKNIEGGLAFTQNTDESESAFIEHRAKQLTMLRLWLLKKNTFGLNTNMLIRFIENEKFKPKQNHKIGDVVLKQAHFMSDQYFNQFLEAYEDSLKPETNKEETKNNWEALYNDFIDSYIQNVSLNDFSDTMNHKRLPNGRDRDKILWIGAKNKAIEFGEKSGFVIKTKNDRKKNSYITLNDCFKSNTGKPFGANDKEPTPKDFTELLNKHFPDS